MCNLRTRRTMPSVLIVVLSIGTLAAANPAAAISRFPEQLFKETVIYNSKSQKQGVDDFRPERIGDAQSESYSFKRFAGYQDQVELEETATIKAEAVLEAATIGGPRPAASATLAMTAGGSTTGPFVGIGPGFNFHAEASARIEYFAYAQALDNAAGEFAGDMPLLIHAKGATSASYASTQPVFGVGGYAGASATMWMDYDDGYTLQRFAPDDTQYTNPIQDGIFFDFSSWDDLSNKDPNSRSAAAKFTTRTRIKIGPGYSNSLHVTLIAGASAQVEAAAFGNGKTVESGASASAWIDPVIVIDPAWAYADRFELQYSPAVTQGALPSAVPLPAAAPLLLIGLGVLRIAARRRLL